MISFILGLALAIAPSWATTYAPRPFAVTVQNTTNFVRGFVGPSRVDSALDSYGTKRVYTYSTLEVSDVFKGQIAPGAVIQVRDFGGLRGGVGVEKSGASHFETGEDVAVTLGPKNPDGSYDLIGMAAGKYLVKKDENGAEYLQGGVEDAPKRWTLDALHKLVAEQAASGNSTPKKRSPGAQPSAAINPEPPGRIPPPGGTGANSGTPGDSPHAPDLNIGLGLIFLVLCVALAIRRGRRRP